MDVMECEKVSFPQFLLFGGMIETVTAFESWSNCVTDSCLILVLWTDLLYSSGRGKDARLVLVQTQELKQLLVELVQPL